MRRDSNPLWFLSNRFTVCRDTRHLRRSLIYIITILKHTLSWLSQANTLSLRTLLTLSTRLLLTFIRILLDNSRGVLECASIWCPRRDSNSHAFQHWLLRPACLPFHHQGKAINFLKNRGAFAHQSINTIDYIRTRILVKRFLCCCIFTNLICYRPPSPAL